MLKNVSRTICLSKWMLSNSITRQKCSSNIFIVKVNPAVCVTSRANQMNKKRKFVELWNSIDSCFFLWCSLESTWIKRQKTFRFYDLIFEGSCWFHFGSCRRVKSKNNESVIKWFAVMAQRTFSVTYFEVASTLEPLCKGVHERISLARRSNIWYFNVKASIMQAELTVWGWKSLMSINFPNESAVPKKITERKMLKWKST